MSGGEFGTAVVTSQSCACQAQHRFVLMLLRRSHPEGSRQQWRKGIFIAPSQHALAWNPLSLVALGFLSIILMVMLMTVVSSLVVASTICAGSFQSVGTATVLLSIGTIAVVYYAPLLLCSSTS